MSRRQHTRITFSVEVPLPLNMTQAALLEHLKKLITSDPKALVINFGHEVIIKQIKRETTYL
jgi:hypothetical protein